MAATGVERPAAYFVAAVSLAAMIAAFAIGQARAQPVTPPITQPPPTFNPSTPNTVTQPSLAPLSPTAPSGLSAPGPAPVIEAPTQPAENPQTPKAPEAVKPALSPSHVRRHRRLHTHWRHHRARYHAVRVRGPSYYPGLGEFYPPSVNPCHQREFWSGYYAPYWAYSCGW